MFEPERALNDLVQKLLEAKDQQLNTLLHSHDQNVLQFNRGSLLRTMPKGLHPTAKAQSELGHTFLRSFQTDKTAYQYASNGLQTLNTQSIRQMAPSTPNIEEDGEGPNQAKSESHFSFLADPKHFIAPKNNFTDTQANSKHMPPKYSHAKLNQQSRNITSLAQTSKVNAFRGPTFPTTVISGTLKQPQLNTFAKNGVLDVGDVMRYSLSDFRQREPSTGKPIVRNPFVWVPSKYG